MLKLALLAFAIASVAALPTAVSKHPDSTGTLVLLSSPDAVCLDGSPSGFYFRAASSSYSSRKWMLSLEGGGECAGVDDCTARAKTDLGSSKGWNQTMQMGQIQDAHCSYNPDFCDWNQVFVKYCSGDLWSGVLPPTTPSHNLSINGHGNLQATLRYLQENHNLNDAEIAVLTGVSAGGIGTFLNLDFFRSTLPDSVRVFGVPIAGFYFPTTPYTGPGAAPGGIPFTPSSLPELVSFWNSYLPPKCVERVGGEEAWKCLMGNNSYVTLSAPVFVVEAQTDKVQLILHDQIPSGPPPTSPPMVAYVEEWGHEMRDALTSASKTRSDFGVFSPACYMHGEFGASHPIVGGFNFYEGVSAWAFGEGQAPRVLMDDCGLVCNPTCPK